MPLPRPQVNLDAVAQVLDRVLDHPLAAVAAELLPETHGAVRAVRDNLPAVASGIEAHAVDGLKREARDLERELVGGLSSWIQDTIRKGKGEAAPKRLRAKSRSKANRKAKGKGKR